MGDIIKGGKEVYLMNEIEIPDQEEPITLTQEEYPGLPFKKVHISNPRKLREGFERYYGYMFEKYKRGELKFDKEEK